jgi:hypothetical protein
LNFESSTARPHEETLALLETMPDLVLFSRPTKPFAVTIFPFP